MKVSGAELYMMKKLLISVLVIWFGLSLVRIINNLAKIYTEERDWIFLSDDKKREKLFGDVHGFLSFSKEHARTNSRIVFILPPPNVENRLFYLGEYYLYPRDIYFSDQKKFKNDIQREKPDYILIYDLKNSKSYKEIIRTLAQEYNNIAFSGKKFSGSIYYHE